MTTRKLILVQTSGPMSFPQVPCTHVCVYDEFYTIVLPVGVCIHHHRQGTRNAIITMLLSVSFFMMTLTPPSWSLNLNNHYIVLHI